MSLIAVLPKLFPTAGFQIITEVIHLKIYHVLELEHLTDGAIVADSGKIATLIHNFLPTLFCLSPNVV